MNVPGASSVPVLAPQAADVRAGVRRRLVEADARHRAVRRAELDAELDRVRVARVERSPAWRSRRSCPRGVAAVEAADAGPVPSALARRDLEGVGRAVRQARDDGALRRGSDAHRGLRARADVRRDRIAGDRAAVAVRRRPAHQRLAGGRARRHAFGCFGRARGRRREQHVDPIVGRVEAATGEGGRGAVGVDPVDARFVGECLQRRVADAEVRTRLRLPSSGRSERDSRRRRWCRP